MRSFLVVPLLLLLPACAASTAAPPLSGGIAACEGILRSGVFNETQYDELQTRWVNVRNFVCSSSAGSFAVLRDQGGSITVPIDGLPVTIGGHNRETDYAGYWNSLCSDEFFASSDYYSNQSTIKAASDAIVGAWSKCMEDTGVLPYASVKAPFGSGQLTLFYGSRSPEGRDKLQSFRYTTPLGKASMVSCDDVPADGSKLKSVDQFTCNIDVCGVCGNNPTATVSFSFAMSQGQSEYVEWRCPKAPLPPPPTCESFVGSKPIPLAVGFQEIDVNCGSDGNRRVKSLRAHAPTEHMSGCITAVEEGPTVRYGGADDSCNVGTDATSYVFYRGQRLWVHKSKSDVEQALSAAGWPHQPPPPPTLCQSIGGSP